MTKRRLAQTETSIKAARTPLDLKYGQNRPLKREGSPGVVGWVSERSLSFDFAFNERNLNGK